MAHKIVIKNARLSYAHLFRPESITPDMPAKYSASWIIRKDDPQVQTIKQALDMACDEKFPGKRKAGWPASLHCPLKDGDELADEHPEYAGCYVLPSASTQKPKIFDRKKFPVSEDDDLIYSGCYCNVSLAAAGFDVPAKKGVTVYLNGVQFVKDGERLSGHDAANDFDDMDDDDDLI